MKTITKKQKINKTCFAYHRYEGGREICTALNVVACGGCPFYKSKKKHKIECELTGSSLHYRDVRKAIVKQLIEKEKDEKVVKT